MPTPPYPAIPPGTPGGPPNGSCYAQHRVTHEVCGLPRNHVGGHSWERMQTTAETTGVRALLDEVQEALADSHEPTLGTPEARRASAPTHVAVAYVLGRRNMPLSEAPRVRHLLELRKRGHAV